MPLQYKLCARVVNAVYLGLGRLGQESGTRLSQEKSDEPGLSLYASVSPSEAGKKVEGIKYGEMIKTMKRRVY